MPGDLANKWPVCPDEKTVERIPLLWNNFSTNEVPHQHRYERDRQTGRSPHGVSLGKSQRGEKPAFLGLQRKDGEEAERDDQQ